MMMVVINDDDVGCAVVVAAGERFACGAGAPSLRRRLHRPKGFPAKRRSHTRGSLRAGKVVHPLGFDDEQVKNNDNAAVVSFIFCP